MLMKMSFAGKSSISFTLLSNCCLYNKYVVFTLFFIVNHIVELAYSFYVGFSPFQFQVLPSDSHRKVNVSVPGLESGVCAQIPQTFTIDSKTGEAPESVAIMTPSGKDLK